MIKNPALAPDRRPFRWSVTVTFLGALLAAVGTPSVAADLPNRIYKATAQGEGRTHSGPRGYHTMCAREPKLCMYDYQAGQSLGVSAPHPLTRRSWRQLDQINRDLNWQIRPIDDNDNHGVADYWTIGITHGDCEDYVIAKKHALIDAGWSADQLLYAVVEGRSSPYHLVLIVRTDRGDFVLDNLTNRVRSWKDSGYTFIVRQSAANPTKWVHVTHDARKVAVAKTALAGQ